MERYIHIVTRYLSGSPLDAKVLIPHQTIPKYFHYHDPFQYFVEYIQKGLGGPTFNEKPAITGPIHNQIQKALEQLENIALKEQIYKRPDKAEAERVWSYLFRALEKN